MTSSSGTHPSLIEHAKGQSSLAWEQIVAIYSPLIMAWGQRLGCQPDACDDLCQEVLSAAARGIHSFQADGKSGSFRGWLWRITYRKWIDTYRKNHQQAIASGGSTAAVMLGNLADPNAGEPSDPSSPDMIRSLVRRAMAIACNEFQESHWQAFWLTTVDGISTEVVAGRLTMSPAGVRQARSRILRRIRAILGDTTPA